MSLFKIDSFLTLKNLISWEQTDKGLVLNFDFDQVQIDLLSPRYFRLHIAPQNQFDEYQSSAVVQNDFSIPDFSITNDKSTLSIVSEHYDIEIQRSPFNITATRKDGSTIWQGKQEGFYSYLNNEFQVSRQCHGPDYIYGLGEKSGSLNRMGQDYTLWNTDILSPQIDRGEESPAHNEDARQDPLSDQFDPYYMSIPFFQHVDVKTNQVSASFIDNPCKSHFRFQNKKGHGSIEYRFTGGQYCEYIFAGPSFKEILEDYTSLTGRMQMPPLWALGYHQCRWKRYKQDEVLALGKKHRELKIPCESLWLDIDYMDGYRIFTWNDQLFPDRQAFFKEAKGLGFRIVPIVDPGVKYEKATKLLITPTRTISFALLKTTVLTSVKSGLETPPFPISIKKSVVNGGAKRTQN